MRRRPRYVPHIFDFMPRGSIRLPDCTRSVVETGTRVAEGGFNMRGEFSPSDLYFGIGDYAQAETDRVLARLGQCGLHRTGKTQGEKPIPGITGGMVPWLAALVAPFSAVAMHRVGFGLFPIVAFSAGLVAKTPVQGGLVRI
jgi:hypothetical protein